MVQWICSFKQKIKIAEIPHHPPIGYRYGWNLAEREHQMTWTNCLLTQGVDCLFAPPNCAPCGNNSRASSEEYREKKRSEETLTLTLLAIACFFQVLLERKYLIENSGYSDIFWRVRWDSCVCCRIFWHCLINVHVVAPLKESSFANDLTSKDPTLCIICRNCAKEGTNISILGEKGKLQRQLCTQMRSVSG